MNSLAQLPITGKPYLTGPVTPAPFVRYRTSPDWECAFRYARRAAIGIVLSVATTLAFPLFFVRSSKQLELPLAAELESAARPVSRSREYPSQKTTGNVYPARWSARVLLRLEQGENAEPNPHYRDDIRIAWLTCLYAFRNEPTPFVRATYAVLGVHPDEVFAHIQAERKYKLGQEFGQWYDPEGNSIPESSAPKKSASRAKTHADRKRA